MRLSACLLLLLLLAWSPVARAGATDTHRIEIEVRLDRSELVTWRFTSPEASRGFEAPPGATLVSAEGASARMNGSRIELDPPATTATLTLLLPPPDESLHPLYSRRFPVPDGAGVELSVAMPAGFLLFHASHGELVRDGSGLAYAGRGGGELVYAYRSAYDADTGLVEIDEGIYHVLAPARSELAVRRIAALATDASIAAADHAGLPLPRPIWVRFAPDRAFGSEAGSYGNDGIVAIRREELSMGALDGHPWRAAETLVHETLHVASLPHGDARLAANVTWWLEGSARFSERFVSGVDGWRACDAGWCVNFQSQLNTSQLRSAYDGTFDFLPGWSAHNEARYRHAAYLVAAYVDRYGSDAFRGAWEDVRAGARSPACPCDEAWLLQILVEHSGGRATRDEIYRPFGDLRVDDRAAFDARVASIVARAPADTTPTPWRPVGAVDPAPQPRAPAVALEAPLLAVPDAILRARVEGVSLLEDESPPGPPDARLVVRLDGEAAAPASLRALRGNVTLAFAGLAPGEHHVQLEAVSLHGVPFVPAAKGEARFVVHPTYELALDPVPAGVYAPPILLSASVLDAQTRLPLANVTVALHVDAIRVENTMSGADGRVYFEVAQLPRQDAVMSLVVEDEDGAALAQATAQLPAPPSVTPAEARGVVPAAGVEPDQARDAPDLRASAVLSAVAAVALAIRLRRHSP